MGLSGMHIGLLWEITRKANTKWVDNIKMDLREIGWDDMDWIDLAQNRDQWRALVNTEMNLRVPKTVEKLMSICTTGGF
jgi:hypothetical protein